MTLKEFRDSLHEQRQTRRMVIALTPVPRQARTISEWKRAERENRRLRGIIDAMTPAEREFPFTKIDGWRVRRIARGAGVDKSEVIELLESAKSVNVIFARAWLEGRLPFRPNL